MSETREIPSEDRLWAELRRATVDKHHEWRTPVLATVDTSGGEARPKARVVVLRSVLGTRLRVFTDSRSLKVQQLMSNSAAELTFWSSKLRWQLRAACQALVVTDLKDRQASWERVRQGPTASDYLSTQFTQGKDAAPRDVQDSFFSIIELEVKQLDWLQLASPRHLEVQYQFEGSYGKPEQ